jgi:hypothetical protein
MNMRIVLDLLTKLATHLRITSLEAKNVLDTVRIIDAVANTRIRIA